MGEGGPVPGRTAYTPCDYPGCDLSPAKDGVALFRVNVKGETGVFMCPRHAREVPHN